MVLMWEHHWVTVWRVKMNVLGTRDTWWMAQSEAVLLAEGIAFRWDGQAGIAFLDVPASEVGRASVVLSEMMAEELARKMEKEPPRSSGPLWLEAGFAMGVGLAITTVVFFVVTGGAATHSEWQQRGALISVWFWEGQWWRIITAATLHADTAHAAGNAGFFVVLGWAAEERFGVGVSLLWWIVTAMVGFLVSLMSVDTLTTVGASGGLFGLLGAAAGHAARHRRHDDILRRGMMRSLGGAILLLAFTAFGPRANIRAHVAGFVAGIVLGVMAPRLQLGPRWQAIAALTTAATVWGAWAWALR